MNFKHKFELGEVVSYMVSGEEGCIESIYHDFNTGITSYGVRFEDLSLCRYVECFLGKGQSFHIGEVVFHKISGEAGIVIDSSGCNGVKLSIGMYDCIIRPKEVLTREKPFVTREK